MAEVVLKACENNHEALQYASIDLKKNEQFIEKVLHINPKAFKHADPTLWNNLGLIKLSIKGGKFEVFETNILRN